MKKKIELEPGQKVVCLCELDNGERKEMEGYYSNGKIKLVTPLFMNSVHIKIIEVRS